MHRAEIPSYDELGKLCYMTIGPEMARLVCMKVYGPYGRLNENIREVLEWIEANGYTITYPPRYSYVDGI